MKALLMRALPFLARIFTGVLAGIFAIAVIIWFGGRFVGLVSVNQRLVAIGILFGLYLLWLIGKFFFLRFRGEKLADDLTSGIGDDQLKQKLNDALTALKSTDLGRKFRGKGALYALPWYMIIGPSAAGKSTFYSRSGLKFPFKDDEKYHLSGIGGTKNCDWWFSDQAVLIDTAGRYSSEESSTEWIHFLQLLKKNRPRVPVNGVVLALPIDELLTPDNDLLQAHAHNTRNRLQEVMSELGLMVPVYIVITKCDMLRGFDAFFEDLSDAESAQPWGVYVLDQTEDKKADVVTIFEERVSALNQRLLEQRTQKMMLAQTAHQRADIYQYPSQFAGASDRLVEFIGMLFKDSPYHEKPWFAGVYFTSSVQEGDVLERKNSLLKDMFSKALGFAYRSQGINRSYFISEFFTQVIFPLKDAVRGNRSRQRFHLAAKSLSFVIMAGIIAGLGLTLTGTYTANIKLMGDYEQKAETLVDRLNDPLTNEVDRLSALTGLYRHYQDLEKISTYSPLQLFSRYDLIGTHGEPMRRLLVSTLESKMASQVAPYFKNQFLQMDTRWANMTDGDRNSNRPEYYRQLEIYLMLTSHADRYDRDLVADYLGDVWFNSFGDETLSLSYERELPTLKELAGLYLQFSFEGIEEKEKNLWDLGETIAVAAQNNLITPPNAATLYKQLVSGGVGQFEDVTLRSLLGASVDGVIESKVSFSGIYTSDAWGSYVNNRIKALTTTASEGDWVLGLDTAFNDANDVADLADKLQRNMRRLYFSDYAKHWQSLVGSSAIAKQQELSGNIRAVKSLADANGVMVSLFKSLEKNLTLTEVSEVSAVVDSEVDEASGLASKLPAIPVIPTFAALSKDLFYLLKDSDDSGQSDFLEAYLYEIQPLAEELDTIAVASDIDKESRQYAAGVLSGNSGNKKLYSAWINVNNLLAEQPEESRNLVSKLTTTPLSSVWSGMVEASERSLQAMWQEEVYRTYNASLRGRFPFSAKGSDATVRDVNSFFKPDSGLLWEFVETELKPFVQVRSGNWKVRTWLGIGLSFDDALFSGVNSANSVVNGLFDEYDLVGMRYWVSPVPSPGVSESVLEVDSNVYRYRNEPEEWREFNWALDNSQFAQIQVQLNGGAGFADLSFDGPWAFLKLLNQSQIEHSNGTQFNVAWPMRMPDGKRVLAQYKVRADRSGSILNQTMLQKFYLPKNLFKG
jgi:type VI secretion system protein ImpL